MKKNMLSVMLLSSIFFAQAVFSAEQQGLMDADALLSRLEGTALQCTERVHNIPSILDNGVSKEKWGDIQQQIKALDAGMNKAQAIGQLLKQLVLDEKQAERYRTIRMQLYNVGMCVMAKSPKGRAYLAAHPELQGK